MLTGTTNSHLPNVENNLTHSSNPLLHRLFFLLFFFFFFHAASQLNDEEQTILLQLKQHWQNPPSLAHWTQSISSHCSWPEITCNDISVTGISLPNKSITTTIPPFICDLKNLTTVDLQLNYIPGNFPTVLYNCSKLQYLDLSQNYFVGKIPVDVDCMAQLRYLNLAVNNFSGEIPKAIGNLSMLQSLMLSQNQFSGIIPIGLWSSLNLSMLMVSENSFVGELPNKLGSNLSRLEISNNKFSGKIPAGISSWRNMVVFDASNNLFTGPIPEELTALPSLNTLFLDRNRFSGHLPLDIISWDSLTALNLSRNQLSGQIPEKIGSLPRLTHLDLSENDFSGKIPAQLGGLTLTSLNLSSNHLTGRIPSKFENADYDSSFLNNPGLCATKPYVGLIICNSGTQNSSKFLTRFLVVISSIVGAIFIAAFLFVVFMIRVRRKGKGELNLTWKLTAFHRLDFTESNILENLTENNLIGSGGSGKVYCIAVNHQLVAVKKIWNDRKLDYKLEKEFRAEVETLGTIRHSNIVKLLCYISGENSKLLVYEYLENRSLDRWLHEKKRPLSVSSSVDGVVLDWPKRLKIAVGAAQGLCYMHHDCSPSIIHRDVKSSNILLDYDFNAKIADFGLAKILLKQGEPNTMSAVVGSFGYMAPEYAQTRRVSEKIDVYSFGVILLELATGS